jgi:hypothetical protein
VSDSQVESHFNGSRRTIDHARYVRLETAGVMPFHVGDKIELEVGPVLLNDIGCGNVEKG